MAIQFKENDRVIYAQQELFGSKWSNKKGIVTYNPPQVINKIWVQFDNHTSETLVDTACLEYLREVVNA